MAKAVILDNKSNKTSSINSKKYPFVNIDNLSVFVDVNPISLNVESFNTKLYDSVEIKPEIRMVKVKDVLPFRVRFTSIGIEGYGANNAPAIPLQVIGYSNYIL